MNRALQRAVVRSQAGPLRPLWATLYRLAIRAVAAYLRRGTPEAGAYVARTLATDDAVYGLSDVDLIVVVPGDPARPKSEHLRLIRRWQRLARLMPLLGSLFSDTAFYEDADLRAAISGSALTYGLENGAAAFFGRRPPHDDLGLRTRPGLHGPTSDWRLVAGRDRRPPRPPFGAQERRVAAWLELQFWWGNAFELAARPDVPWAVYGAVKLVAEPARILLTLRGEEVPSGRREAVEHALRRLPEHEEGLRLAAELLETLGQGRSGRDDAVAQAWPHLVGLSVEVAQELGRAAERADAVDVVLARSDADPITADAGRGAELLPLADWRAVCAPTLPDEAATPWPGDARDPGAVAAAARIPGPYPLLRADGLLILASLGLWTRSFLRAVHCAADDPVTTAVATGARTARFPDLAGWSARDWGRRAVAEHRAWLTGRPAAEPRHFEWLDDSAGWVPEAVRDLAKLLTAVRAALFLESIEAGSPELALTVAAVPERLATRSARTTAETALTAYRACIESRGKAPPDAESAAEALRRVVLALPAYQTQ